MLHIQRLDLPLVVSLGCRHFQAFPSQQESWETAPASMYRVEPNRLGVKRGGGVVGDGEGGEKGDNADSI